MMGKGQRTTAWFWRITISFFIPLGYLWFKNSSQTKEKFSHVVRVS